MVIKVIFLPIKTAYIKNILDQSYTSTISSLNRKSSHFINLTEFRANVFKEYYFLPHM